MRLHSTVDIITNSSSESFVVAFDSEEYTREFLAACEEHLASEGYGATSYEGSVAERERYGDAGPVWAVEFDATEKHQRHVDGTVVHAIYRSAGRPDLVEDGKGGLGGLPGQFEEARWVAWEHLDGTW